MGTFNWFTKKEKSIEIPKTANKWISVSLVSYWDKSLKKEDIENIAEDIGSIIDNTKAIFNKDMEFIGCINPYLNINHLMINKEKEIISRSITNPFFAIINKDNGMWKITLTPLKESGKPNFYSLPNLYFDMFILAQANQWILKRHQIKVIGENQTSIKISMVKGYPIMELREPILNFKYSVEVRMKEYKKMPELDRRVFGEDFEDMI